jgi:hypothetical protein
MAEITVRLTGGYKDYMLAISPRGNGIEWTVTRPDGKLYFKVYKPKFDFGEVNMLNGGDNSYMTGRLTCPFDLRPLQYSEKDALRLYDYFCEKIEWSPDALASGTAHPDLMAAQQRHSAMATPSAGGGGSSRKSKKSRKTRKSRK